MAGEWPIKTIADCASSEPYSTQIGPFGKALMANNTPTPGYRFSGVNVNRGPFHDDDFVFIDDETAFHCPSLDLFPATFFWSIKEHSVK